MGINPYLHDERFILQLLNKSTNLINFAERIRRIYFYGAGSSSDERKEKISGLLKKFFKNARVIADHDIKASALSTLGDSKGLIGILGSGANAAYFNGRRVLPNNYGMGYILADEGSANWIGRQLLKGFLTETMPNDLREPFLERHPLDRKQILEKIYNNPYPTLFLTSFADFVQENHKHKFVKRIINEGIGLYLDTYVLPLSQAHKNDTIHFTGSVAAMCEVPLREAAAKHGLEVGKIVKEPIHNLLKYHINKN